MTDIKLHHGDCLDILRTLPDASVDAVVTDPPYLLGFMGREWDTRAAHEHLDWHSAWCREAFRVLKPGGHLLAFGGTRTWHRLACAVEDAGFEVRDSIAWLHGQGFPKSLDVSKAIDRDNGRKFEDRFALGRHIRERREALGFTRAEVNEWLGSVKKCQHYESQALSEARVPTLADFSILRERLGLSDEHLPLVERVEAEREVIGERKTGIGTGMGAVAYIADSENRDITAPATDAARTWQGWGTALKPAFEPVVVARKPLSGTVAGNVLAHGTGALNIDATRIQTDESLGRFNNAKPTEHRVPDSHPNAKNLGRMQQEAAWVDNSTGKGRWPANVILDETQAAALDEQSGTLTSGLFKPEHADNGKDAGTYGAMGGREREAATYGDSGGASRFFYIAKADSAEHQAKCAVRERVESVLDGPTISGADRKRIRQALAADCECSPCPGRGNDGHGLTHCAECCFGTGVEADLDCPIHGMPTRFRYEPKADASERVRVNGTAHPTVKPLALMRWLVRLVTPPGGTVLEPFAGSGTTVEACILEGFHCIAIEREADYLPLIRQRIARRRDPVEAVKASGEDGGLFDLLGGDVA